MRKKEAMKYLYDRSAKLLNINMLADVLIKSINDGRMDQHDFLMILEEIKEESNIFEEEG